MYVVDTNYDLVGMMVFVHLSFIHCEVIPLSVAIELSKSVSANESVINKGI